MYKANDTVHVKAYIRVADSRGRPRVPDASVLRRATFRLSVNWVGGGRPPRAVAVEVDATHGSCSASLHVPVDAQYAEHSILLYAQGLHTDLAERSIATATVAVADPRPPTVELAVTTPISRVMPPGDGIIALALRTTSLSGVPLQRQRVTIRWRIDRSSTPSCALRRTCAATSGRDVGAWRSSAFGAGDDEGGMPGEGTGQEEGEEAHSTGDDGIAQLTWRPRLPSTAPPLRVGDAIKLDFEFIGPTRERLTHSLSVPVAIDERVLSLTAPKNAQLPHHRFHIPVQLQTHAALGGGLIGGVPIALSLQPLDFDDGDDSEDAAATDSGRPPRAPLSHGDEWLSNVPAAEMPPSSPDGRLARCEVLSASVASESTASSDECGFALPGLGRFLAIACALESPGGAPALCSAVVVGRTEAEWRRQPLGEYLPLVVSPMAARPVYALGDTPHIELTNPLTTPLRALLAWGNHYGHRHMVSAHLPPGANRIELPQLGAECSQGCDVGLTLVAAADASRALTVPASPLLDPTAPMLARFTVALTIQPPPEELRLTVGVSAPVVAPGTRATLTVSLTDVDGRPAGGEVTLFVVDKALLAVRPHPLRNLSRELRPRLPRLHPSQTDTYQQLASPSAVGNIQGALMRMLAADPWLPVSWPSQPGRHSLVEQSLATVLAAHTSDVTDMPYGGGRVAFATMEMMADDAPEMARPAMMMARSAPMERGLPVGAMAKAEAAPMARMSARANGGGGGGGADAGAEGSRSSGAATVAVKVRSAFETTPLFLPTVRVGASGRFTHTFQLPDNTGAFEIRAYATGTDGALGGGVSATQLVRKRLTLDASIPRIARVGDRFRCGVTATGSPELPPSTAIVATIALRPPMPPDGSSGPSAADLQPIRLLSPAELTSTLGPFEVRELAFELSAEAVGQATLVITVREAAHREPASAATASMDAIELTLPVLGVQPAVTVATSMALRAVDRAWPGGGRAVRLWPEALRLPAALRGSGTLTIGASAGRLASVRAIAQSLLDLPRWHEQPCATSLLAAIGASALLAPYAHASSSSGVRRSEVARAAETALPLATEALRAMTSSSSTGLHYSTAALAASRRSSVDLHLNALGVFTLRRLRLAGVVLPDSLAALGQRWHSALAQGLVSTVQMAIDRYGEWRDLYTLATCRLALGASWQPSGASSAVQAALSVRMLDRGVEGLSLYGKAAYALLLLLPSDTDADAAGAPWLRAHGHDGEHPLPAAVTVSPRALALLRYLASCLRVTARTAYLAYDLQSSGAAGERDTALALSALSIGAAAGAPVGANLDKLANHVASGGFAASGRFGGGGGSSSLVVGLALTDYDGTSESLAADVHLTTLMGATKLFDTHLQASDVAGPATKTLAWAALPQPPPPPPLVFAASGEGEASVALSMHFVPASLMPSAIYHGIEVAKVVQEYDALHDRPTGPPLAAVPLGMVVSITLQLTTPDELSSLVVEDWLPAGLEAIDPLADGHSGGGGGSGSGGGKMWPWLQRSCPWMWWRCASWSRETRKDALTFYSPWAHAGTHTLRFEAVATTAGTFALPPTKASAALEPEVMGLSAGGTLRVGGAAVDAAAAHPTLGRPLAQGTETHISLQCPHACSGRGACNTTSGKCECAAEAAGDDCSQVRLAPSIGAVNANDTIHVPTSHPRGDAEGTQTQTIALPLYCPTPWSSMGLVSGAPPPPPPAFRASPSPVELRSLIALSADEAILPSSALALKAASLSLLHLHVTPPRPVSAAVCVRVTVAASADGLLYGSRVVALWLTPPAAASTHNAPPGCFGDGEAYAPPSWEASGGAAAGSRLALGAQADTALAGSAVAVALGCAAVVGAMWLLLRRVRRAQWRAHARLHEPEPTESPGSQSGGDPPSVELCPADGMGEEEVRGEAVKN